MINSRPKLLAMVTRRTREKHGMSLFNNAFNTTVFAGGDGLSLCNDAHTFVGTAATQDNLLTAALSPTAVSSARLAMRDFQDDTGNMINVMGDTIIVPPELEQTAYEIINTEKQVNSANNNANFLKGRYSVVVSDYLTDTDNWYMVDSKYMKMFLKWFDRTPVEFNKDKDFDTYIGKWSVYNRYSYGFSDWRWILGNQVS